MYSDEPVYYVQPPDELSGLFSFLKPIERAIRAPANALIKTFVPGGSAIVAAHGVAKNLLTKPSPATIPPSNAAVAAGLQQVTDAARAEAQKDVAKQAGILGTLGLSQVPMPLLLGAAGLAAFLLFGRGRRRNPPRRRRRRRRR